MKDKDKDKDKKEIERILKSTYHTGYRAGVTMVSVALIKIAAKSDGNGDKILKGLRKTLMGLYKKSQIEEINDSPHN